jgi:hypothetical protein
MELEVENAQLRRLISDSTLERPSRTNKEQSNARADARGDEVWSENAQGNSMSVAGCTRKEKVPNAWRGSRQRSSFREAQRQLPARPLHRRSKGTASPAQVIDPRCAKNGEIASLRRCMGVDALNFICPPPTSVTGCTRKEKVYQ